jgi:two-component system chemotaxis response regulator CheY
MSARILVVDDAIFMRKMLADILQKGGYEVCDEAGNGSEAVQKYEKHHPDLVTMDIIMPDMSGIDAIKKIKGLDSEAKIVVVSAMGHQSLVVEAIQAGAKDYVVKPFQPSRVIEAVQRVLKL